MRGIEENVCYLSYEKYSGRGGLEIPGMISEEVMRAGFPETAEEI